MRKLLLPLNLLKGFWQAFKAIRQVKPNVVLGMGGYITFPGGMMAALTGVPLVLHEQNSVAGLANKVLSGVADRIVTGFPNVLNKGEWVGNPVRPEIARIAPPAERFAERNGPLHVLVIGGSLGAQALNEIIPQGMAQLAESELPQIVHQAGEKHIEALQANYAAVGVQAHCVSFIEDMAGAYEWADLVICRAGALTIAELAAAGVASILVPFPHAVDDHQTGNARFLVNVGGAFLLPQTELTPDSHRPDPQLLPQPAAGNGRKGPQPGQTRCRRRGGATLHGYRQMKHKVKNIHFVGVGGSGMSGIAEVLAHLDFNGQRLGYSGQHDDPSPRRRRRQGDDRPCRRERRRRRCAGRVHRRQGRQPGSGRRPREEDPGRSRAPRCWPS